MDPNERVVRAWYELLRRRFRDADDTAKNTHNTDKEFLDVAESLAVCPLPALSPPALVVPAPPPALEGNPLAYLRGMARYYMELMDSTSNIYMLDF